MRLFNLLGAILGLGLIAGCGGGGSSSSTNTRTVDLTGSWARPVTLMGSGLSMTLQETGQQVTGSGNYAIEAGRSGTYQITGTADNTSFNLTFTYDYGPTATYAGQITDASHLNGSLQQTGTTAAPTTFVRQ